MKTDEYAEMTDDSKESLGIDGKITFFASSDRGSYAEVSEDMLTETMNIIKNPKYIVIYTWETYPTCSNNFQLEYNPPYSPECAFAIVEQ
jgi:hypothetical protein